jgi:alkanesulfonate monooxygenase SsuD/methylene tetrahydromethanopterin reductase-like flavin-dependent oxidoreductase (luciferase family)
MSVLSTGQQGAAVEIGSDSFAASIPDPITGVRLTAAERMQHLLQEMVLADQVGLDVFGIGEHHRPEFLDSAPPVILAAAAALTKRIRLTSAVTVLSAADPVRVFQQFATLDLISQGRAEIVAGRGSFIESFPLFGLDLDDYDSLFAEKLELLLKIREGTEVYWSGKHRPALNGQSIYPRPIQNPLPIWLGVGGTPASFARAGTLGLPLMVAIIGGEPHRFRPHIDLYREADGVPATSLSSCAWDCTVSVFSATPRRRPRTISSPAMRTPSPRSARNADGRPARGPSSMPCVVRPGL